jgi:hypothetical protein
MNRDNFSLLPSEDLSAQINLLFFAVSIKEFYKKNMTLELTIPNSVMSGLDGNDFNTFFSDILLDSTIPDEKLIIKVTQSEVFKVRLYGHVNIQ